MSPSSQSDYILRVIEQLGAALRRIRELLARGAPAAAEARDEARAGQWALLGHRSETLQRLDAETAVALLADPRQVELWTELLRLEAVAARELGDGVGAAELEERARDLERASRGA